MRLEANQVIKMRNGDSAQKYNDQEVKEDVPLDLELIAWNLRLQMYPNTLFLIQRVPNIYDQKYIIYMFYIFDPNLINFKKILNFI